MRFRLHICFVDAFNAVSDILFFLFVSCDQIAATDKSVTELVSRYMKEIEKLKAKLIESEQMYHQLKKSTNAARKNLITFADTDGLCFALFFSLLYLISCYMHIYV